MVTVIEHEFLPERDPRPAGLREEAPDRPPERSCDRRNRQAPRSHARHRFAVVRLPAADGSLGSGAAHLESRDRARHRRGRRRRNIERAPQENLILLHDHILDKKILDLDDHEVEIVYDVKLAFQNGKLYAAEVDFSHYRALRRLGLRKLAKLLTNRNKEDRVSWLYVQPLPEQLGSFAGNIKLKVPKAGLSEIHPVDLADILEELEGGQRVALFNALDAEQASDTLEEVEPRVQRELIRAIEKERAAQLINEMTPAQAADILAILPRDQAGAILKLLDQDKSSKVEHIIGKHDEQILLYGSPELIGCRHDACRGGARPLSRARDGQGRRDVRLRHRCAGASRASSTYGKWLPRNPGRRSATS
jgi:hypothetical protein